MTELPHLIRPPQGKAWIDYEEEIRAGNQGQILDYEICRRFKVDQGKSQK